MNGTQAKSAIEIGAGQILCVQPRSLRSNLPQLLTLEGEYYANESNK